MRIFLLRRRHLVALLGVVLVLAIFAAVNAPAAVIASASTRQLPIYCVDRSDNLVSISFDAAWGNEDTQQLIEILDQYQVKATFFVVGDWVDKYPESVKALHDAGHEVMNTPTPTPTTTASPPRRSLPTWRPATTRSRPSPACGPPSSAAPMGSTMTTSSPPSAPSAWSPSSGMWNDPIPVQALGAQGIQGIKPHSLKWFHNSRRIFN